MTDVDDEEMRKKMEMMDLEAEDEEESDEESGDEEGLRAPKGLDAQMDAEVGVLFGCSLSSSCSLS